MTDLKNPKLIYLKAVMLLLIGVVSAVLLVREKPTLWVAVLLAAAVWSFARVYYFAFYVIERYVDPSYRFSGLWSFARYVLSRRQN